MGEHAAIGVAASDCAAGKAPKYVTCNANIIVLYLNRFSNNYLVTAFDGRSACNDQRRDFFFATDVVYLRPFLLITAHV